MIYRGILWGTAVYPKDQYPPNIGTARYVKTNFTIDRYNGQKREVYSREEQTV